MNRDTSQPHVLFICRGNLCRSPMAMALLRHRVGRATDGLSVTTSSAGYYEWEPFAREAHPYARRAVVELCGSDLLADHIARSWNSRIVAEADLVVVAEGWMSSDFPRDRVVTMRELAGEHGDVEDPYGGDYDMYIACAREIDRLIAAGAAWLREL